MGEDTVMHSGLYYSVDGLSWTYLEGTAISDLALAFHLGAGEAGYAFTGVMRWVDPVGSESDVAAIWTSSDALTWTRYDYGAGDEPALSIVGATEVAVMGWADGSPVLWRAAAE